MDEMARAALRRRAREAIESSRTLRAQAEELRAWSSPFRAEHEDAVALAHAHLAELAIVRQGVTLLEEQIVLAPRIIEDGSVERSRLAP